ncbi:aryl-sulfate sulfotransferase [Chloroflexota bacterium]
MSYARTSLKGVTIYDSSDAYHGYTLITPVEGQCAWLIDMMGRLVNRWTTRFQAGWGAQLLPNGNLLYAVRTANDPMSDIEGTYGVLLEIDWDGHEVWEYADPYLHHASCRLGNGNTLLLKWVELPDDIASKVKGGDPGTEREGVMWGDVVQEVTPQGDVAWEWLVHEHLDPSSTPRCPVCPRTTWTHANSVAEALNGDVLISLPFSNTIAIIDKTTGHVTWQWGDGEIAHQHSATMLDNGNVLVFDNGYHPYGFSFAFSRVIEIDPGDNKICWTYGGGKIAADFYSSVMGTCQRLPNGNTLINEATSGRVFEVSTTCEIVWEFSNHLPSYEPYPAQTRSHMVYSAYRYGMEYPGLKGAVKQAVVAQLAPGTSEAEEEAVKTRLERLGY